MVEGSRFLTIFLAHFSLQSPTRHRDIPSAYLLTTKDEAFRYEYQVKTVQRAGITVTETFETGHSPFLSRPEEVKDFVVAFVTGLDY